MQNIASGIDLVEIDRLEGVIERHSERFLKRVFTANELDEVGDSLHSLAGRFAAKEAVAKALGSGIGLVGWHDIEILRGLQKEPRLFLHGKAQELALNHGLVSWSVSLSHTHTHAVAMVVAIGDAG